MNAQIKINKMENKEIETWTNENLETICPYCGNKQENDQEVLPWTDDEICEVSCRKCDEEYKVSCYISYSRESYKMEK